MSVVTFYKELKKEGKRVLILMDHDGTVSKEGATPLWEAIPEDGCVDAYRGLLENGDIPVPFSARPIEALLKGYQILGLSYVYNEGHGIRQTDVNVAHELRDITFANMPNWDPTAKRLATVLTVPGGCKLSDEGNAYFYFIPREHPDYITGASAMHTEAKFLNEEAGAIEYEVIEHGNGIQLALVNKIGKAQGIRNYLEMLCNRFNCSLGQLFEEYIGGVIFADDSPHHVVQEAQAYVKGLTHNGRKVGFAIQVSRDDTIPPVIPDHIDQVVGNAGEMVAKLGEMAAYQAKL